MKTLDALFMEVFADIQLRIYGYDIWATRWILNQFVRDQVIKLMTLTHVAMEQNYIRVYDEDRINKMILASCERMLQDLDKQEADI